MIKKLFYFFILFAGIILCQGKNSGAAAAFTVPTNVMATEITLSSAKLTWSPIPGGQYLVEFRVSNGVWVGPFQTVNTFYDISGLIPCTVYEARVRDATNPADVSNTVTFKTRLNYCLAGSVDPSIMQIVTVSVTPAGGLPQMISNSGASTYTDYREDPTRQIYLASDSSLNSVFVSKGWASGQTPTAISVWIDFNGNGDFEPSERIIGTGLSMFASGIVHSFSVPASASGPACGVTMRVMMSEALTTDACTVVASGEVEDYNVIFTERSLAVDETGKNKDIHIYPNPVSDIIHISGTSGNEFEIYNTLGQKIREGKISDRKVDVHDLVEGVYFLQVRGKENSPRLKFIKK